MPGLRPGRREGSSARAQRALEEEEQKCNTIFRYSDQYDQMDTIQDTHIYQVGKQIQINMI